MNSIEGFARPLQALPPTLRWLSAQQDVVRGTGTPLHRGRVGIMSDRIVSCATFLHVARPLIAIANLVSIVGLYCWQFSFKPDGEPDNALFVGIAALREPSLVKEFEDLCGRKATRLDERDIQSFFAFQRVGLVALLREWLVVWQEIWPELGDSAPTGLNSRLKLSFVLRAGYRFIYLRAWFRRYLKLRDGDLPIAFSAASFNAAAAIAAGAKAIYFQHGFQRRSIVYPDFSAFYCFNRYEGEHFLSRLPKAKVIVRPEPLDIVNTERAMLIAGVYGKLRTHELSHSIIEWALKVGLPIIVRPHPADTTDYWKRWKNRTGIRIDNEHCDFDSFLLKVRPRLVVTWFSTTLFDAIKRGAVPVTLSEPGVDGGDVVFPFDRLAIRWPDEKAVIERLINDPDACVDLVREKYADATGALRCPQPQPAG